MRFDFFPSNQNDDTKHVTDPQWQNLASNYQSGDENVVRGGWRKEEWQRILEAPQVSLDVIFQQARARLISMDIAPISLLELTAQWNVEDRLPQVGDLIFQRSHLFRMGNLRLADLLSAVRIGDVVDEPNRFELQVVALKGHPERGASRYILLNDGHHVWFRMAPISKPANTLTRLADPILTRRIQVYVTASMLDYMVTAVTLDLTGG